MLLLAPLSVSLYCTPHFQDALGRDVYLRASEDALGSFSFFFFLVLSLVCFTLLGSVSHSAVFSPSQPAATSDHPLLCWLDSSLVKSQRLNVTSPRSLLTDYNHSFFSFFSTSSSSSTPWRIDHLEQRWCILLDWKTNLVWQVKGSEYRRTWGIDYTWHALM